MKLSKAKPRWKARKKEWERLFKDRHGFKAPGSYKKPFPAGKGRRHSASS